MKYRVSIPGGLSFLVTGDFSRQLPGLNDFPEQDRPPVMVPFVSYHLMVGVGSLLATLSFLGLFLLWRCALFTSRTMKDVRRGGARAHRLQPGRLGVGQVGRQQPFAASIPSRPSR